MPKTVPLLDKVRTTIHRHSLLAHGDRVVVGVSGGPDSLALLHALRHLQDELGISLHVAHLNHKLRGEESDADAEFVQHLAWEWKLPITVEARDVHKIVSSQRMTLEEAARYTRYDFLLQVANQVDASIIAVGHNMDDQAETVLMHFLRGAGLAGLRGMRYKSPLPIVPPGGVDPQSTTPSPFVLIRPLLDIARNEIEEYCKKHYLAVRIDRTNFDTHFFRNRLRHQVMPFLETLNPNLRQVFLHMSHAVADDFDFISRYARAIYPTVARQVDDAIVFDRAAWSALHQALQRSTLRFAVQHLRGSLRDIDWTHIEDARLIALEKSTSAEATLPAELKLVIGYSDFVIADAGRGVPMPDAPLLHVERVPLPDQGIIDLPNSQWQVETQVLDHPGVGDDPWTAVIDFDKCQGERYLRRRKPGDRFQPFGMGGRSRSLQDFMIDEKIQRSARAMWPLLVVALPPSHALTDAELVTERPASGDSILWVCGVRIDERFKTSPDTRRFWQITFRKKENR